MRKEDSQRFLDFVIQLAAACLEAYSNLRDYFRAQHWADCSYSGGTLHLDPMTNSSDRKVIQLSSVQVAHNLCL